MTDYKLVPYDPAPEMVSAAEDAYMPFGDMELALRMAILAAPAVQADYQRLQADHKRLQAELELWKAKIDAMAEHEVAAYQLIGIPASVGISEPVEGFARRPQDIMPAVRDMALRIELLESQLAESEALLAESRANDRQAMAYLAAVREVVGGDGFPEMAERVEALQAECEKLRSIISDLKGWDCDVRGGFLSIPVDLRRRMQEAIDGAMQEVT